MHRSTILWLISMLSSCHICEITVLSISLPFHYMFLRRLAPPLSSHTLWRWLGYKNTVFDQPIKNQKINVLQVLRNILAFNSAKNQYGLGWEAVPKMGGVKIIVIINLKENNSLLATAITLITQWASEWLSVQMLALCWEFTTSQWQRQHLNTKPFWVPLCN